MSAEFIEQVYCAGGYLGNYQLFNRMCCKNGVLQHIIWCMALDAVDKAILEILQDDGRITNAELAQRIGLTPAPTLARVHKLESAGYVKGYAAIVDRQLLGLPVTAFVAVILKSHGVAAAEGFLTAVRALPEVLECHHIAGAEDYLLKVVAASPGDYESFVLNKVMEIPDVQRVQTTIVLSSPISNTAIPIRIGEAAL
jgi:Lrp/AsnC family leucine-responsive transcriptional regulator